MINKSNYQFTDISSEEFRTYVFESGAEVNIVAPKCLSVSKSGGHRILDEAGRSHYVPSGWIHLYWIAKNGQPNFVR